MAEPEPEPPNSLLVVRQVKVLVSSRGRTVAVVAEVCPAVAAEVDTATEMASLLRKGTEPLGYPQ